VLERGSVGQRWRTRYQSLRLLTPNWMSRLPDWSYRGGDAERALSRTCLELGSGSHGSRFFGLLLLLLWRSLDGQPTRLARAHENVLFEMAPVLQTNRDAMCSWFEMHRGGNRPIAHVRYADDGASRLLDRKPSERVLQFGETGARVRRL
jgi:hypothetical protein